MVCPFAEKKGAAVYCKILGKRVNPLAYPCLSKKYEKCKIYQEHKKHVEERAKEVKVEEAAPISKKAKGIRLDGSPARNCRECIYYGKTGVCLLLGIEVEDPDNPPCMQE